jgi:hypothetical protein
LIKFQKKEFYIRIKFFFFIFLIKKLNSKKEKKIKKMKKLRLLQNLIFLALTILLLKNGISLYSEKFTKMNSNDETK